MSKEQFIDEILKMSKELIILTAPSLEDLRKLYIQTKITLETLKSTLKDKGSDEDVLD